MQAAHIVSHGAQSTAIRLLGLQLLHTAMQAAAVPQLVGAHCGNQGDAHFAVIAVVALVAL